MQEYNKIVHNNEYIKAKDLAVGATYIDKNNKDWVYMGKFDYWEHKYEYNSKNNNYYKAEQKGKRHFFVNKYKYDWDDKTHLNLNCLNSLSKKFIGVKSNECCEDYSELFEMIEGDKQYSPIDYSKNQIVEYTYDEFLEKIGDRSWTYVYDKDENKYEVCKIYWDKTVNNKEYNLKDCNRSYHNSVVLKDITLEEIFNHIKPIYKNVYLQNNKLYERMY